MQDLLRVERDIVRIVRSFLLFSRSTERPWSYSFKTLVRHRAFCENAASVYYGPINRLSVKLVLQSLNIRQGVTR